MDPNTEFNIACLRIFLQLVTVAITVFGAWWALVTWEHSNILKQAELGRQLIDSLRSNQRCENALAILQGDYFEVEFYGDTKFICHKPVDSFQWMITTRCAFHRWDDKEAQKDMEIFILRQLSEFHRYMSLIQRAIDAKQTTLQAVEIPLRNSLEVLMSYDEEHSIADEYLEYLVSTADRDAIVLIEDLFPDDAKTSHWFHDYHFYGRETRAERAVRDTYSQKK
ncbi:hypothetical protein ACYFX5_03710 [Bremerella sp. T1]|uniref:hypothetical protein n=1 Tax=Bremerella sp. TYQ1 TaxID=3119568 RepID=UPI001CD02F0C|nr:hypothetical protein [Bremerella volcania]UBM37378.1 hypothetical protein LA756_05665 [Bremerella volcania]